MRESARDMRGKGEGDCEIEAIARIWRSWKGLTDAARGVVLELGGVGDVGEGARGDGVADVDAGHDAWRGICAGLEGGGGGLAGER